MASNLSPLSPHISIYRWRLTMLASILHRASGVLLILGVPLALWLLLTMAHGHIGYYYGLTWMRSMYGMLILWLVSTALCYHTCNGIRFLLLDIGITDSRQMMKRSAKIVVGITIIFAILLAVWL